MMETKYCVYKNTANLIMSDDSNYILQNVLNVGFTTEQIEILTQEEFDARKALEPKPTPEPSEIDVLRDYVLEMEFRMIMKELEV